MINFIRLGRPLFLVGGFLFNGLGAAISVTMGARLNLPVLLLGQLIITAIQLMTHYSNDYFDLEADRANRTPTRWSGGSRVLPDGLLRPSVALGAALVLAAMAVAGIVVLVVEHDPGPLAAPLLLLALALAWSYSAPPLRLHSTGVGELVVALLVPGVTTLVGFYLQMGRLALLPLLAIVPLCCFQFVMLTIINFPDAAGDAAAGKRTLVVRLGGARAARLGVGALALAYGSLPVLVWLGLPLAVAGGVGLSAPVGMWQLIRLGRGEWAVPGAWESLAFWGVGLLVGTAALELVAFVLI